MAPAQRGLGWRSASPAWDRSVLLSGPHR